MRLIIAPSMIRVILRPMNIKCTPDTVKTPPCSSFTIISYLRFSLTKIRKIWNPNNFIYSQDIPKFYMSFWRSTQAFFYLNSKFLLKVSFLVKTKMQKFGKYKSRKTLVKKYLWNWGLKILYRIFKMMHIKKEQPFFYKYEEK